MTDSSRISEADVGSRTDQTRVLAAPMRAAGLLVGLLAMLLLLYHGSVLQIVSTWNADGGYSHGWLILGLVVWILFDRRHTLFAVISGARWPAVLLSLGAVGAGLAAGVVSVQLVEQLSLLALIVLLPMILFGWRGGLGIAGALALLVFTVPMWQATIPLLQGMTVQAVDFCLDLSRVPAYIVDNIVTIPSGQFRIVQGCSGMHFFVSGFALAAVYAYLYLRTWKHRIALVLVTLAVAILANWIRVYVVILLGYLTEMQHYLVQVDHYMFGWVLFGVALIPVFFLASWMERREERAGLGDPPIPSGDATLANAGILSSSGVALLVILSGAAGSFALGGDRETEAWCPPALPEVPGWTLTSSSDDVWRPDFHGETTALAGRYQRDGIEIIVWVMFYQKQRDGAELIYYANRAFDPDRWRQLERSVTVAGAGRQVVSLTLEDPREQRRRLSYWYEVGGRPTHQRWAAKALQIPALIGGRGDAALIAVSGVCEDGCESVDDALEDFFSGFPQMLTRAPVAKHCGVVM